MFYSFCHSFFCFVLYFYFFFFFNDTATTEIYTLSLHDALPISNVLGEAVSLAERVHPIILGTSWDFSSGQLLFSNKWGRNPSASLVSGLSDSLASQVRLSARQRLRRPNC